MVEEGLSVCCDVDEVQQVVPTLTLSIQHTPTLPPPPPPPPPLPHHPSLYLTHHTHTPHTNPPHTHNTHTHTQHTHARTHTHTTYCYSLHPTPAYFLNCSVGTASSGTVGSEDEGAMSRQTSVEILPESKTDTPAEVVIGEDTPVMQVACGLVHTGEGSPAQLHHWLGKAHTIASLAGEGPHNCFIGWGRPTQLDHWLGKSHTFASLGGEVPCL